MISRALIALLLVMNLVLAVWLWLRPAAQADGGLSSLPGGAPPLILLSEEPGEAPDAMNASAEPDGPPQPTPPRDRLECAEIGPFLTQADLRRVMNAFAPSAERIQFRETRTLTNRGYWVYLPAQRSRDAALSVARELSAKGLRDYYVVTSGERENMISLGLFQNLENARQRHEQLRALGFDARLQPRSDEIPNYWIDLAAGPGHDWSAPLGSQGSATVTLVPCR